MGGIQMLLVLFAVILFSSIIISTYDHLYTQADYIYNELNVMQGQKIAEKYFQQVESEILGHKADSTDIAYRSFDQLYNDYNNFTDTITLQNITYNININSNYCDKNGIPAATTTNYQKIDIWIVATKPNGETSPIGTEINPISKLVMKLEG